MAEADRWDDLGWNTQAQAQRIIQLGELVHFAPWDERLRANWRMRWEQVKEIGAATRDLAYAMTPQVIAMSAWSDVMASAGADYRPNVRPVPVMWASGPRGVVRSIIDGSPSRDTKDEEQSWAKPSPSAPYEEISALRFRRVREQPVRDNPEDALDAILRLANSTEFQDARRALYTAEALAAAGQVPPEEFGRKIDVAVSHYNHGGGNVRRRDGASCGPPCGPLRCWGASPEPNSRCGSCRELVGAACAGPSPATAALAAASR